MTRPLPPVPDLCGRVPPEVMTELVLAHSDRERMTALLAAACAIAPPESRHLFKELAR